MQLTGLWLYITLILGFPFTEGDQNYANAVQLFRYKQLRAQNLLGRSGIKFKIIRIPPKRISISPPVLSSLRQVQVKRSKHHSKELLLPNSQSKKPPDFRYNFDYNRAIYKPRYFHGGLFAPKLSFLSHQQRHGIHQHLSKGYVSCSTPYTATLGHIECRRGRSRYAPTTKRDAWPVISPSSRTKNLRPHFRPRGIVPHQLLAVHQQHNRRKRQDAAFSIQKRGPGCMRRCLEARILHPAQCHSLC